MENSKLLDLLRSFSTREWRRFGDFLRSPYFNRSETPMLLFDWLEKQIRNGVPLLERSVAFSVIYPALPYNDAQMNQALTQLLRLAEQFVGQLQFEQDDFFPDYFAIQALAERNLEKNYRFRLEKKRSTLYAAPLQNARYFLESYWLEDIVAYRRVEQAGVQYNEDIQRAADSLDNFYLATKLRYTLFMLTSEKMLAVPYRLALAQEINVFIASHPAQHRAPLVHAYHLIYQLLTKEDGQAEFVELRDSLPDFEQRLNQKEVEEIYQYALNYCNLQSNAGKLHYQAESLALYIRGIDSGILLTRGQLSPWNFKNVVKLGLLQQKFDWIETFINEKTVLLQPELREDAFHFNLAELYYHIGERDKALIHLNRAEFTHIAYQLAAKIMLAKIYFETGADMALDSLLHAFNAYLRRNKVISEEVRRSYLNFVVLLRRIMVALPEQYGAIR